ncbi:MAG: VWA domain-containing protein [Intestinibacter sp.]|uniref:vWA domain-containing protein n=1 Tax=Intestinibacter sp. TaxID=1965304 RepID=UPI002A818008|nr:VWA domain-containing protein [Intestinibacter sp.]MDY4574463.1 VWA domain-containing protein [Intestinibacter sp.]
MSLSLDQDTDITNDEFKELDFDPLDVKPISKRNLVLFFLIDTSGGMSGKKIGTINNIMEELLPKLIGLGGALADIKLAVMTFSSGCEWITKEPVSVYDYQYWTRLKAEGLIDLGQAFEELSKKLSRKEFLNSPSINYAPVIFLLTDGYATDDVIGGLEKLQHNDWYKYGLKVAIGIGEKFDEELLTVFTGIPELVVTAKAPDKFAKLVETIELTSSQMQSGSMTWFDEQEGREATSEDIIDTKEKELAEAIKHILTMWIYNHSQVENYTNALLDRYLVKREIKGVTIPIVENKEQEGSYEDVIEIDISDEFTY